jgi:hypothetical protein
MTSMTTIPHIARHNIITGPLTLRLRSWAKGYRQGSIEAQRPDDIQRVVNQRRDFVNKS